MGTTTTQPSSNMRSSALLILVLCSVALSATYSAPVGEDAVVEESAAPLAPTQQECAKDDRCCECHNANPDNGEKCEGACKFVPQECAKDDKCCECNNANPGNGEKCEGACKFVPRECTKDDKCCECHNANPNDPEPCKDSCKQTCAKDDKCCECHNANPGNGEKCEDACKCPENDKCCECHKANPNDPEPCQDTCKQDPMGAIMDGCLQTCKLPQDPRAMMGMSKQEKETGLSCMANCMAPKIGISAQEAEAELRKKLASIPGGGAPAEPVPAPAEPVPAPAEPVPPPPPTPAAPVPPPPPSCPAGQCFCVCASRKQGWWCQNLPDECFDSAKCPGGGFACA